MSEVAPRLSMQPSGAAVPDETAPAAPERAPRSLLRQVAVPTEHGGWGLTLEPALLGLLVAPGLAAVALGLAALVGFLARTPLRVALVDARRRRRLPRTRVARRVAAAEGALLVGLLAVAALTAPSPFWPPLLVIGPLVAVELWFDLRSRSRRLAPELAGTVAVTGVVALIALAGGAGAALAAGLWCVLAGRALTSIPHVRAQVGRLHQRPVRPGPLLVGDLTALAAAGGSVLLDRRLVPGALAVVAVIALQRGAARRPVPRAAVLGVRQLVLGLAVVLATAAGVLGAP